MTCDLLTFTEWRILLKVAEGATNKEIAAAFLVNLQTVKNHVENVCQKLKASNRAQAVAIGFRLGYLA